MHVVLSNMLTAYTCAWSYHIHVHTWDTVLEKQTCNNVCTYCIPVCFVPHQHLFRIIDKLTRVGCFDLTESGTHQSIEQVTNDKGREVFWSSKRMLCLLHHIYELHRRRCNKRRKGIGR